MTREEAINMLKAKRDCIKRETSGVDEMCNNGRCVDCPLNYEQGNMGEQKEALDMAIKALEQEPCDCISRKAVIEHYNSGEILQCNHVSRNNLLNYIEDLPPVTPKQKTEWIPVSERLPEDFQRVLVTIVNYKGDKVVRVAEYYNRKGVFQIKENHEQWEVGEKGLLAWMPLPEPYTAESEGKK